MGHLYRNKLTKNGEVTYSYLFKKSSGIKFVLNFRKFSNVPAKIKYGGEEISINKLSKSIIIEDNNITCFGEFESLYKVCIFDIKIQVDDIKDTNDSLDFSIQLIKYEDNESTQIYLPQNTFMSGLLIPKKRLFIFQKSKIQPSVKFLLIF
jgi:hypothetical protein